VGPHRGGRRTAAPGPERGDVSETSPWPGTRLLGEESRVWDTPDRRALLGGGRSRAPAAVEKHPAPDSAPPPPWGWNPSPVGRRGAGACEASVPRAAGGDGRRLRPRSTSRCIRRVLPRLC